MKIRFFHFLPAIAWLISATFLLLLPGNELPEAGFFDFPNRDKLVHVIFFCLLTYLFSFPFKHSLHAYTFKKSWLLSIALYSTAYGIIIEFIQKYFVPNRSYDEWDILADAAGSFIAYWMSISQLKKVEEKIGPDGNRGRNQN